MPQPLSAGILLFRECGTELEVLLIHPGGPYWKNRDEGAWMIPKGGVDDGEAPADAAMREFTEETGGTIFATPFHLCRVRQSGGKIVEVYAARGDFDPEQLESLEFEMEWPPRSGRIQRYPECDEARWMSMREARLLMLPSQLPMLEALEERLRAEIGR